MIQQDKNKAGILAAMCIEVVKEDSIRPVKPNKSTTAVLVLFITTTQGVFDYGRV